MDVDGFIEATKEGIVVAVWGRRFFIGFARHGWLKEATLAELFDCQVNERGDVAWPRLGFSIGWDCLVRPGEYPGMGANVLEQWARRRAARWLGKAKSEAKAEAARANGRKGGKPKQRISP